MGLLRRKMQIAAEVEAVKGTAETLVAADAAILAEVIDPPKVTWEDVPRRPVTATLSPYKSIPGVATGTFSCKVEIKGSGTAATPPAWGDLLRGCGFKETIGASVVYTPDSDDTDTDTLTMAIRCDGKSYLMYGARGNVRFTATANQILYAEFTFNGIWSDDTDTALFTGVTYESTLPQPFRATSTSFNFGTAWTTSVFSDFVLDATNTVSLRSNANSTTGLAYAQITDRDFQGTIDLDTTLVATQDIYGYVGGATTAVWSMDLGSAAGNHITFAAPVFQVTQITEGERLGIATSVIEYHLRRSTAGDDELTITHA